jgi:glutaconate CoA-transferase subunit B
VTREDVIEATGWEIRFADQLETTPAPTAEELEVLRDLKARTNAHHASTQSGQQ